MVGKYETMDDMHDGRHIDCPECRNYKSIVGREGAKVVDERSKIRGAWDDQARVSQNLKMTVRIAPSKWPVMKDESREAVDQILEKLARVLTGDEWEAENWVDIQGYAELMLRSRNIRR